MGERAITYVDSSRPHDDDKAVSRITDAVWVGSLASDMLDVVFDVQHGDRSALERPVLITARDLYRELAAQLQREADFFESGPPASQVNRLSGSPWLEDEGHNDSSARQHASQRFTNVADALDNLAPSKKAEIELLQGEFRALVKQSLIVARNASEHSIRVSPWSTR